MHAKRNTVNFFINTRLQPGGKPAAHGNGFNRFQAGRISPRHAATTIRLALLGLALCALTPHLHAEDANSDFQAIQAAAARGDAKAQYELGNHYEKVNADAKAAEYWHKSAEQGYAPAQTALGSAYGRGVGVGMDIANAVMWYRKAAGQGYAVAEFAMGNFYAQGTGVTNDLTQAIQWWKKAAAQNYAGAEAALGELHVFPPNQYGTNCLNYPEGLRWLRRAAAHGSTAAMNNLGLAYETGTGVKTDAHKAARWYREAAERGGDMAQANLGECYLNGYGVPRDPVEAYKWIKLSAMQGCFLGSKDMSIFSDAPLKPKDLAEAEQRVLDFRARTDTNYPAEVELVPVTNSSAANSH